MLLQFENELRKNNEIQEVNIKNKVFRLVI